MGLQMILCQVTKRCVYKSRLLKDRKHNDKHLKRFFACNGKTLNNRVSSLFAVRSATIRGPWTACGAGACRGCSHRPYRARFPAQCYVHPGVWRWPESARSRGPWVPPSAPCWCPFPSWTGVSARISFVFSATLAASSLYAALVGCTESGPNRTFSKMLAILTAPAVESPSLLV